MHLTNVNKWNLILKYYQLLVIHTVCSTSKGKLEKISLNTTSQSMGAKSATFSTISAQNLGVHAHLKWEVSAYVACVQREPVVNPTWCPPMPHIPDSDTEPAVRHPPQLDTCAIFSFWPFVCCSSWASYLCMHLRFLWLGHLCELEKNWRYIL